MRIGIDLGGTKIEILCLDEDNSELLRHRIPTPQGDYDATVKAIRNLVQDAEQKTNKTGRVGIGIPGTVSKHTGLVKNANSTCLIGKPFKQDLEQALKREIRLTNDANCFALSEATDGAAAGYSTVFGVIIGTGTGGGMIVDGKVIAGLNGLGGEWGHNPLPWASDHEHNGPPCYCGQQGCIETFLSGGGLERTIENICGTKVKASELQALPPDISDPVLSIYENRLARALASIINIFDPDAIVLGGGLSNIDRLYKSVPTLWHQWVFGNECETPLLKAKHGDSSGVRGAAWLWPLDPEQEPHD